MTRYHDDDVKQMERAERATPWGQRFACSRCHGRGIEPRRVCDRIADFLAWLSRVIGGQ